MKMRAVEIKAEEFESENPVKVQSGKSITQIKNLMEEQGIRAVPVVDEKNRLEGVIGYRDLIRYMQFNPSSTKLEKVMHQPPSFDQSDSLIDICELRINSGRKLMVRTQGRKLHSVIGDQEFLKGLSNADELEDIESGDIATYDLITAFEEDSIEEVRHKMLDSNISRVPILDSSGKLTGIVRSTDLLKALIERESMDAGGAAGNREGSEVKIAGGGEKESLSDIPVEEIMKRTVNTSSEHMQALDAISKMQEQEAHELIFMEERYPESILTLKDLVKQLANFRQKDAILVTLVGLDVPEEKASVHKKIRNQIRGSIGRKLERPEELKLRFKKADKDGKRHRYDLNLQLVDGGDVFNLEVEDWDLLDAVDEALEELDTVLRKRKGKKEH